MEVIMSEMFMGFKVPSMDIERTARYFNGDFMHGCAGIGCECSNIQCEACICNTRRSNYKKAIFALYLKSLGVDITRNDLHQYLTADWQIKCQHCGDAVSDNSRDLCEACYQSFMDGELNICPMCGHYHTDDNDAEDAAGCFCDDCAENFYICGECGNRYRYDDSVSEIGDCQYCHHCIRELGYRMCADCGEYFYREDMIWDGDDILCDDCYNQREHNVVHDYSYRPNLNFKSTGKDGKSVIYLGFELESGDLEYESDRDEIAYEISEMSDLVYLKHDGSIPDYGFEMVTHPMSFWYHKDNMPYRDMFSRMIDAGLRSHDASDSCGLHVHVNRNALSYDRWLLVDWFVHRNKSKWEEIARRKDEHYAKFKEIDPSNSLKDNYGDNNDRYTAVNFCNRSTVEFRLFKGSLRYETVIGTLAIVDAVVSWAKIVKVNDILRNGAWKSFVQFMKEDSKYVDAIEYLKYREMLED
jgi:hypothetical protein